jgi:hypothetical protein
METVAQIDLARALLELVRLHTFPHRTHPRQDPYTLLSALLSNALTPSAIADDIIATASHRNDFYDNMEYLTDYYANSLLVMTIISLGFLLIVVRRGGGRTPTTTDHPSREDNFDQHVVDRRHTKRNDVFLTCYHF